MSTTTNSTYRRATVEGESAAGRRSAVSAGWKKRRLVRYGAERCRRCPERLLKGSVPAAERHQDAPTVPAGQAAPYSAAVAACAQSSGGGGKRAGVGVRRGHPQRTRTARYGRGK